MRLRRDGQRGRWRRQAPVEAQARIACPWHGGTQEPLRETGTGCVDQQPPSPRRAVRRSSALESRRGPTPRAHQLPVRKRRFPWVDYDAATGHTARSTGKAACVIQRTPVRGPVAVAGESCRIDECLGQQDRIAVHHLHIRGQPPQAQPQNPRCQVRHPHQHDETGVVGYQMQTRELPFRRPSDPAVTCRRPEPPDCQPISTSQLPSCTAT